LRFYKGLKSRLKMIRVKFIFFNLMMTSLLFLTSCKKDGGFAGLEDEIIQVGEPSTSVELPIEILSFSPVEDPVVLTAVSTRTFALQVKSGAGDVNYSFKLDGTLVQNSSSPFYNLSAMGISAGAHELEVILKNSVSETSKMFNLRKNTPPSISLNSATNTTISCVGGTFTLSVNSSDIDGDTMSFSFFLNGAINNTFFNTSYNPNSATVVFTPNCSLVGANTITVRVTDEHGEFSDYSASVTVSNPAQASITSYSPITNPVVITSTGTQQFIISPDGSPPYTISWTLTPGGVIAECANNTSCNLEAAPEKIGSHTLSVNLTDNNSTTASLDFNVIFNARHTFSVTNFVQTTNGTAKPSSTSSDVRFNCNDLVTFNITSNDQNFGDAGQSHDVTWTYGGSVISNNSMFSIVKNIGSNPVTSTLTFNPNCNAAAMQGEKDIVVTVTDGLETRNHTWTTKTNYLTNACLNLQAGEICTIAGKPGLGSGVHVVNQANDVRIQPSRIIQGPDPDTYFISDRLNGTVWFYNDRTNGTYNFKSCVSSDCNSTTGPFKLINAGPKTLTALVGVGVNGLGSEGEVASDFYLNQPRGLAWDNTEKILYIAEFGNDRITKVDFNPNSDSELLGRPQVFGGQCTPIASCTNNMDVTSASLHKCSGVQDLVLTGPKLYASCYSNPANEYTVKVFDIIDQTGKNLLKHSANDVPTEGALDGTAASRPAYGLIKHPSEDALIVSLMTGYCNLLVLNISGSPSFFGGTVAPAANSMMRLTRGTTACNNANNQAWNAPGLTLRANAIHPRLRSGSLQGFYLADFSGHNISFLNTSDSSIMIGNVNVAIGALARIWGSTTAGLVRPASAATGSNIFNNPLGLIESSNKLIVADEANWNLTTANTHVADGETSNLFNSRPQNSIGGYDGDPDASPISTRLNAPTSLFYSENDNKLYISDTLNYRIRSLDLTFGLLKTEISNGVTVAAGNVTTNNTFPNANGLPNATRDLFKMQNKNALLYVGSGNNSHHVRAYNQNTTGLSDEIFTTHVNIGRVSTIIGVLNLAAAAWNNGTMGGNPATDSLIRLNSPWGVVVDGVENNLYLANTNSHCILKVGSDGLISQHIGLCGTAYTNTGPITDGNLSTARFFSPRDMELDPTFKNDGNFFVTDGSLNTAHMSSLRYVNLRSTSVTIRRPFAAAINVPGNEVRTLVNSTGLLITGVAAFEDWVCYSQGLGATVFSLSSQKIVCFQRDPAQPADVRNFGLDDTVKGKIPYGTEQEGIDAEVATFAEPSGLAFDSEGNLYIAERRNSVIRMIKRWF
jgi:hypothetical protein